MSEADRLAVSRTIWEQEVLSLLTVGIDIGSSTSHLLFARVILKRQSQDLSSRFAVVERHVIWRSSILLTPFCADATIDAAALRKFFQRCYRDAGLTPAEVDSGAVILTGEALKRVNARAIDEIFAGESGKFVCATAGHRLEAILAAHGSGASALSKRRGQCGLHVDIGGGTTKLALIDRGEIVSVAAFAVGGRLIAQDPEGAWTRVDASAALVAAALGLGTTPRVLADPKAREAIADKLADLVLDQITEGPRDALGKALAVTEPLERKCVPEYLTFSGGVAEYIFGYEKKAHGDIGPLLAAAIARRLAKRIAIPIVDPGQRIRATVIGASQFTVQVSGKTIYMNDPGALPVRNVPVVTLDIALEDVIQPASVATSFLRSAGRQDRSADALCAFALQWRGAPDYVRLKALAQGIAAAAAPQGQREQLLVLVTDGDIGRTLGRILDKELGLKLRLVSIDGLQLQELDFIDLGAFLDPPGVVPVVIKSLLFT